MQVQKSKNYAQFKTFDGNRNIVTAHLEELKKSMGEELLVSPIIVNENFEVIDGQHRLASCEALNLPVHYIVCEGYGLKQIQRYNTNLKNWTMDDFQDSYIQMGKKEYEFYKKFRDDYGFGHQECLTMLTGVDNGGKAVATFREGKLRIKNHAKAEEMAREIKRVSEFYPGWKRRSFVQAMLYLLKHPNFSMDDFISKLRYQSTKMVDCSNYDQYLALIEDIYNFKSRNKINLRYS